MAERHPRLLTLVSLIVSAHLEHNSVETEQVGTLIHSVYKILAALAADAGWTAPAPADQNAYESEAAAHRPPARHEGFIHPIYGQTVCDDHLVCMEDGLRMKMLKRHLQKVHGLTPEQYRSKWGLSPDYPMVSAGYARLRSSLAVESGLGLKPGAKPARQPR
ncbi:MucR family transcriptional regulator [Rhodopila sp.]|uniref:MucR family transcriptional regulator n=1 Tax=Rhodopila sp. TaxID=2480087 RepID=UPI002D807061|nr:MucR family transcriptional regulator [Rhodopila sp.]